MKETSHQAEPVVRISVVVPTFNHARFIGEALRSVFVQSVDGLEIIVIDDGSSDDTATIAERLLAQQSHPYRVIRQRNRGAHAALNAGVSLARGEYVSFLNSDDRYVPGRLPLLLAQARQHKRRFLITRIRHIDGAGHPLPPGAPHVYHYERSLNARTLFPTSGFELLRHNYTITTGNFFLHRSLVDEVGPFGDLALCHDWDYALRALLVEELLLSDTALYEYRVHPQNTLRPTLNDLRYAEIDDVVSGYLRQAELAANPLAPCFKNWGGYWHYFIRAELGHLAHLPKIARFLADLSPPASAPPGFALETTSQALLIDALAKNTQRIHSLEADLAASSEPTPPDRRAHGEFFAKARIALKKIKTVLHS
jgi:glycosyltransferase involved in cell wall biosynthesis